MVDAVSGRDGAFEGVVSIVGAGSIGVAFAVQFARSGFRVRMWDPFPEALPRAAIERADRRRVWCEGGGAWGGPE